nr:immunoglobulin heavy chain junction region [Mus musculus]
CAREKYSYYGDYAMDYW